MGGAPYLGEIRLFWCDTCNVPKAQETPCGVCAEEVREVEISPPGDSFPAMEGHLQLARAALDRQFGQGTGTSVLPDTKTIVMNKAPSLDSMFEIIIDGYVIGRLRYDIPKKQYTFLLTLEGGRRTARVSEQKWVGCDADVVPFLLDGANLMQPGVSGCDAEIEIGDEVYVTDPSGLVVATGLARMSGEEMHEKEKGYAIKVREAAEPVAPQINPTQATWDDAVAANRKDLERIENEAISFVKRVVEKENKPVVVGFSGGKDSLATYLVVKNALDEPPPIFFIDTGIELPETTEFVKQFAREENVPLIGEEMNDAFWQAMDDFGPPARDYRWCCKIVKLGPAAQTIKNEFSGDVLNFMGQRKLESFRRSREPRVTSNPWVPGQKSANPIQDWNALEVWLYLFKENVPYNPLYKRGYQRIGCFLCPSSSLAELDSLKETHPRLHKRLSDKLMKWADEYGYPEEWVELGFWRWKDLPTGQMNLVEKLDLDISRNRGSPSSELSLSLNDTIRTDDSSYEIQGKFSSGLDLHRVSKVMPIFGETTFSDGDEVLLTKRGNLEIILHRSGLLTIRGRRAEKIRDFADQIKHTVTRATLCQGCGSCVARCEYDALELVNSKIQVNSQRCSGCLECNEWPCPTYLQ